MPSTCSEETPTISMQNFLLYVQSIEYVALIDRLTLFSLRNISRDFFDGKDINNVIDNITAELQNASPNAKLQMFFLLLNVDVNLKCVVMQHEHISVQHKLVRFFDDLRIDLVPKLFTDDRITSDQFVNQCIDLYIIS